MKLNLLFSILVIIACFIYCIGLKVTFRPFHISAPNYLLGVGVLLIIVGFVLTSVHYEIKGFNRGVKDTVEHITNNYTISSKYYRNDK